MQVTKQLVLHTVHINKYGADSANPLVSVARSQILGLYVGRTMPVSMLL